MNADVGIVTTDVIVDHRTEAGTVRALEHPAIVVEGGTSLAVMGPSGCGKSTLLGVLAGLAVPTSGSVTIGETEVSTLSERDRVRFRRRRLGMVYQADNLLPFLTVEENIALPVAIAGMEHRSLDPRHVMERLGIGELAPRFPDQLSGGQRQRVAVARAVAHRPAVILADEPTGSLDEQNARAVIELVIELQRAIGSTLVIVTHDASIAGYADRTLRMGDESPTRELASVD